MFAKLETPQVVAIIVLLCVFAVFGILLFHPVPKENEAAVNIMIGFAGGWAGAVITFYFGSSKSSQDKDDTISAIAKQP